MPAIWPRHRLICHSRIRHICLQEYGKHKFWVHFFLLWILYFIRRGQFQIGEIFSTLAYIMKKMKKAVSSSMFTTLVHIKLVYLKYFSALHFTSLKCRHCTSLNLISLQCTVLHFSLHCTSLHSTALSFMQQDF